MLCKYNNKYENNKKQIKKLHSYFLHNVGRLTTLVLTAYTPYTTIHHRVKYTNQ